MTRSTPLVPALNAGEFNPALWARLDFRKYPYALETAENVILMAEGAVSRRGGTRYIAGTKDSSVKGRLKKFQFSTTQAYILEFGEQAIRFYRHQGQITVADTDAAITNGAFDSNINDWDDRSTGGAGNQISHDSTNNRLTLETSGTAADDIGWAEQDVTVGAGNQNNEHVIKFRVAGDPGDKIEFQVGTSSTNAEVIGPVEKPVGYHCVAFTPGATTFYVQFRNLGSNADKDVYIDDVSLIDNAAVEIATPWAEADLPTVEGPQSADKLYLFHKSHPTYRLERRGHTTWSLVEVAWQDGPWLEMNGTATTLTPSATSGVAVTVTASSVTGINDGEGFQTTDIGRLIRIDNPASGIDWGWGVIVARGSTTSVTVHVKRDFGQNTADTRWRLGAWSGTTGYPKAASFYEQRLFAAGTTDQPQTLWASQTADFEVMSPDSENSGAWDGTVEDDDALDYTISADDVNAIEWLSAGADDLAIGTAGGEWVPSSQGAVLTPSDISVRRQTTRPSAAIQPARVDNFVLFVQRALRKVREFGYAFETDSYQAPDMTRLARHVSYGRLGDIVYAEEPNSVLYAVRSDGQLLSMTYRREEDVVGWSRHIIGGNFDSAIPRVWQVDASAGTFTDETTNANSAADADWALFPSAEAAGDYAAIGHTEPFSKIVFDYANGTAGVGGAVTWEYWDGSSWTALSGVTDNTSGFTASEADGLSVTWTLPDKWESRVLSAGKKLYYVRARITTVYTTNPVLDQGFVSGDAVVESVAVIPGADGSGQTLSSEDRDEVWVIVLRTVNGATERYVEMFERDYETGDDQEGAVYADSMITYDGAPATTFTGLDHLEGETVKIWADGYVAPDKTVSSGQITLDTVASKAQIGLGYYHVIKPLKGSPGTSAGTPLGKPQQIFNITFSLLNCATLVFGPDEDNLSSHDFREVGDATDAAVPLFTGEQTYEYDGDWEADPRLVIKSDDPAPFTLLAWAPEVDVRELR